MTQQVQQVSKKGFKVGDHVIVTGDKADWQHRFETGEVVELIELTERFDGQPPLIWRCKGVESGNTWYVVEIDLECPPPTDEEIADVMTSLGITQ